MEEDDSSLLVVLLETRGEFWERLLAASQGAGAADFCALTPEEFVQQVLVFLNAFLLLNEGNKLAVFAAHTTDSRLLYMSPSLQGEARRRKAPAASSSAAQSILQRLRFLIADDEQRASDGEAERDSGALAGALSRALCFIHKLQRPGAAAAASGAAPVAARQTPKPRVLVLAGCPDVTAQYIAVMNAIFSALRNDVVIDACMVGGADSAFLQQAAHLTGGLYLRPPRVGGLLQTLLTVFCADTYSRSFLDLPQASGVDFRASCFCHKRAIDLGYVCSVCLSIFCQAMPECTTCGTPFASTKSGKRPAAASPLGTERSSKQAHI
ncbi:hypothetical protein WJX81_008450 [Elliptochloris bilobata]|uniref:General transcription and DNA repair factor IIH subunit TFB4 n=1 Tax=Elliptochloris bilobata TaxID=381761 RepID=A0AAW1S733_9CHLO